MVLRISVDAFVKKGNNNLEYIAEFASRCDNRQSSLYILSHPLTTPTSTYMHSLPLLLLNIMHGNFIKIIGEAVHVAFI